jgi:hypothetical protein
MLRAELYQEAGADAYAQFRATHTLLWGLLTLWCFFQAWHWSAKRAWQGLGPMTAKELEILARILLKQRRYDKVINVVMTALHKQHLSSDTRAMLGTSLMQAYAGFSKKNKKSHDPIYANRWYESVKREVHNLTPATKEYVLRALDEFDLQRRN